MEVVSDRKIRFALVGCGRVSKNHIEAINAYSQEAEIVAICDPDPIARQQAKKRLISAKEYINLHDLLQETSADIVTVATPSGYHAEQTIEIARSGRHVITEKPMAVRWADGLRMIKACDDANVRLFVVKQNRYNPTIQRLKKAIEENRFGKIYMVNVNVFWTRPQSYYDSAKWRGTWEWDGGAFMNQASHYIDLLTWLMGPIEQIQAYTGTLERQIEVEDSGVMSIKWKSGALGTVNVTMLTYPQNLEGSITILGKEGSVRIGGIAVNEIQLWNFSEKRKEDDEIANVNYIATTVYGSGHRLYYRNVIDVLHGEASPQTDGREGLKSLEILTAAYQSAQTDKPVSLPLEI